MITPAPSPQLPPAQQDAAAALAAVAASRTKLLALALHMGQTLEARILGPAPGGLTQLALGGQTLSVALPAPLPAGTRMLAQVQRDPGGQPQLVLRPAAVVAPPPAPVLPPTPAPAPALTLPATVAPAIPAAPADSPPAVVAPAPAPAPVAVAASAALPAAASPVAIPTGAVPAPAVPAGAPVVPPAVLPPAAPSITMPPLPAAPGLPASPPYTAGVPPATSVAPPLPASAPTAPAPALTAAAAAPAVAGPPAPPPPSLPLPATSAAARPAASASGSVPPPTSLPPAVAPLTSPPPALGSAAGLVLGQATQAAARQDSVAPLLQNLAALQSRLATFPRPVAEAALRVLAGRFVVGKVAPEAVQLQQALVRSGVLPTAVPAAGTTASDLRGSLLQLRSALLGFLGPEIAPVAPVARRPPPPTRDGEVRGFRAAPPTLPETATPREAGRVLLQQTDAALARLRLLQLASLPPDGARAGAPAPADWTLELPLLLGSELAVAQFRIAGDGSSSERKRARSWRLQFSVSFSILGEVGAQIGFGDGRTSVALWAEEAETAAALEAMLPELGDALSARGVALGSLRVGRRAPEARPQRAGQLLDGLR